ncbi:MAG TPA: class I SAM-dependent methyltransferase [Candidatus Tectomicrobia bacterium]
MNIYGHPLWQEVAEYVTTQHQEPFRKEWCNSFDGKINEARQHYKNDQDFYAQTTVYLYQATAFFLCGYKRPYYGKLFEAVGMDAVTILDYGCGAGQDGAWFAQAGYQVSFADVPSVSLDFLRWRLERSGATSTPVYELGYEMYLPQHDIIWCIDVLEHLPQSQHIDLLLTLEQLGRTVFVTLVDDKKADGQVHYPVEVDALTQYVQGRRHTWWRDYHQQPDGSKVRLLVIGERAPRLRQGEPHALMA